MRHTGIITRIAPWICLSALAAGAQPAPNQLTAAEKKAGWVLLFDGTDKNAHWRIGEGGSGSPNTWIVDAGAMKSPNTGAMLFTKASYTNFEWQVEWKQNKGGNSGLFFRVTSPPGWYCAGSEYAILDNESGGDRNEMSKNPGEANVPIKRTAANYDLYPTTENGVPIPQGGKYVDHTKPYDQWNHGVIWADGEYIEHWLNGHKVVDYRTGSPDWEARFAKSKFVSCGDQWGKRPSGLLGVQDHGGGLIIWIRNLKVRPFTPGEKLTSPTLTESQDHGSVTAELAITGTVIRYTVDGSDPTAASPVFPEVLPITKSATIRARGFRARFQASDVAELRVNVGTAVKASRIAPRRGHGALDGVDVQGRAAGDGPRALILFDRGGFPVGLRDIK